MADSAPHEDNMQQHILTLLNQNEVIEDTDSLVTETITAQQVDGALKGLDVDEYVKLEVLERKIIELTEEGKGYADNGTPEY